MIFGNFSAPDMIIIFLVALVLFGPKKLPEIARTVGRTIGEFRRASSELRATFDREMQNMEAETGFREVSSPYHYDTYKSDYSAYSASPEPPPAVAPAPVSVEAAAGSLPAAAPVERISDDAAPASAAPASVEERSASAVQQA